MKRNTRCLLLLLLAAGCDKPAPPKPDDGAANDPLKAFISKTPIKDAAPLLSHIKKKTFGTEIVVRGSVGEMQDSLAAFRLLDESLKDCNRPEDPCLKPWDY